jgi:glucuronoarabinoxylan endo-1,4-beta-xylanase
MRTKTALWQFAMGSLIGLSLAGTSQAATVAVDVGTTYQKMSGFGASTAWSSTMSAADADLLWSTTTGAGLTLHRIHIDDANGSTSELAIAKLAVAHGVTVWATPWTPPAADKSNNSTIMGTLTNPSAFATYLKGFVATMKSNGVPIYAISAQNEPNANVSYESCVYSDAQMVTWVGGTLGPAFAGSGVKIMAPESEDWTGLPGYWNALKADANSMKYLNIVGVHEYGGSPSAYPDIQAAGLEFWETEIYDTDNTTDPGMGSALKIAGMIHAALTVANVNAWHYWWVYGGNNQDLLTSPGNPTKRLWIMGNYSRYVRPGYYRVGATASPTSGVSVTAFYKAAADSLIIVAINSNTSATSQAFSLTGVTGQTVTPVVTDGTRSLAAQTAITPTGNAFTYSLPSQSVTTFVVNLGTTGIAQAAGTNTQGLKVTRRDGASWVVLPSSESGLLQVRSLDGRVQESQPIATGVSQMRLGARTSGAYLVEVRQGTHLSSTMFAQP